MEYLENMQILKAQTGLHITKTARPLMIIDIHIALAKVLFTVQKY